MDVEREFAMSRAKVQRLIDRRAAELNNARDARWPMDLDTQRRRIEQARRDAIARAEQVGYNFAAMNESLRQGMEAIARGMQRFADALQRDSRP